MEQQPRMLTSALLSGALVIGVLSGCAPVEESPETTVPTSTQPEQTASEEPYDPNVAQPVPEGGVEPEVPETTPAAPQSGAAVVVQIGGADHTAAEWDVSCSGLETSPTVIASATDEDGLEYLVVVIGSGTQSLASFTFSVGEPGAGVRNRSGLTVNPGSGQGNGSLRVEGNEVTSNGKGIAYDPEHVDSEANTTYSIAFTCPA